MGPADFVEKEIKNKEEFSALLGPIWLLEKLASFHFPGYQKGDLDDTQDHKLPNAVAKRMDTEPVGPLHALSPPCLPYSHLSQASYISLNIPVRGKKGSTSGSTKTEDW